MKQLYVIVTGAGGFIGHHLCQALHEAGYYVVGIDVKAPEFEGTHADVFRFLDLRDRVRPEQVFDKPIYCVFALAADMGGMGYIGENNFKILANNMRINANTAALAAGLGTNALVYASSACVYPERSQMTTECSALREEDAYPAAPDTAYGWEKLVSEHLYTHMGRECGIDVQIVRFHNIYGPLGTWRGGREKAPAALCRKVAEAKRAGEKAIQVWGDGEQTRSFCYISDAVSALMMLMESDPIGPVNIGSERRVTINELARLVAHAAEYPVEIVHVPGTQGVRGRNSDSTKAAQRIGWTAQVSLEIGLKKTYDWIERQESEWARRSGQ